MFPDAYRASAQSLSNLPSLTPRFGLFFAKGGKILKLWQKRVKVHEMYFNYH